MDEAPFVSTTNPLPPISSSGLVGRHPWDPFGVCSVTSASTLLPYTRSTPVPSTDVLLGRRDSDFFLVKHPVGKVKKGSPSGQGDGLVAVWCGQVPARPVHRPGLTQVTPRSLGLRRHQSPGVVSSSKRDPKCPDTKVGPPHLVP